MRFVMNLLGLSPSDFFCRAQDFFGFYDAEVSEVQVPEKIEREKDTVPANRQRQAERSASPETNDDVIIQGLDRKSTRLNSSHTALSRMPSSA